MARKNAKKTAKPLEVVSEEQSIFDDDKSKSAKLDTTDEKMKKEIGKAEETEEVKAESAITGEMKEEADEAESTLSGEGNPLIANVTSSFVLNDVTMVDEEGSGESKLHIGPLSNRAQFDAFFEFGKNFKFVLDRDNLLEYLKQVKLEYAYQKIGKYKNVSISTWEKNYEQVEKLKPSMNISFTKFEDLKKNRYYIRSGNKEFKGIVRGIALPRITNIVFYKNTSAKTFNVKLELKLDYKNKQLTKIKYDRFELKEKSSGKNFPKNRIFFGAPGTGKSKEIDKEIDDNFKTPYISRYERVTFHPNYSYANFIGTYKPVPIVDDENNETITYTFVPGPFMRVYAQALINAQKRSDQIKPYLLIIEEINRADSAAVFGDVFQLLDRKDGISEYVIQVSDDIKQYLADKFEEAGIQCSKESFSEIKIPSNMYIWATMNSADQGVFPMDTAFKRRWDFKYIGINENQNVINDKIVKLESGEIHWNSLRKAINDELALNFGINEDKQLGPFFISIEKLNDNDFQESFKDKVIMYLFEDAGRRYRSEIFAGCEEDKWKRYSEICEEWDKKGEKIFNKNIIDYYNAYYSEYKNEHNKPSSDEKKTDESDKKD